jgi:hypothetical protein
MKHIPCIALVIFLVAIFAFPVIAEVDVKIDRVELVNCGQVIPTDTVAFQDEKNTVHKYVGVMDPYEQPKFGPCERDIAATRDVEFGLHILVSGAPHLEIVPLVTRVTHPPITNPETKITREIDFWDSPMNIGVARFAGWRFDQPWELVPGTWTIEILKDGKVLASHSFNVVLGDGDVDDSPEIFPALQQSDVRMKR